MEDNALIRLLFVAGLLAMGGLALLVAYAIARFAAWREARAARPGRTRQTMKGILARGTR